MHEALGSRCSLGPFLIAHQQQQRRRLAHKGLAPMAAAGPRGRNGPSPREFTAVRHFMMADLGLSGLPLLVYAHIFGFWRRWMRLLREQGRPGPPLWCALRRVSRMQRGRAGKGGSEVGRGNRSIPTTVFALFARAAHWAKNPKKCRGPCGPPAGAQPCASKERRGGFRIGGAQACGMKSGMCTEAFGHGTRFVGGGRGGREGWRRDVVAGTEAGSRVATLRSETGQRFPCRLRPMCARDRWR